MAWSTIMQPKEKSDWRGSRRMKRRWRVLRNLKVRIKPSQKRLNDYAQNILTGLANCARKVRTNREDYIQPILKSSPANYYIQNVKL